MSLRSSGLLAVAQHANAIQTPGYRCAHPGYARYITGQAIHANGGAYLGA